MVGGVSQVIYVYNHEMNLLSQAQDPGSMIFDRLKHRRAMQYRDRHGTSYVLRDPFLLYPHIVAIEPSGESHIVVSTPFYLWILMSPFPSWLFIGIGLWIRATR